MASGLYITRLSSMASGLYITRLSSMASGLLLTDTGYGLRPVIDRHWLWPPACILPERLLVMASGLYITWKTAGYGLRPVLH